MEDDIKRWTAKRKAALVMEIIQGKTTVAQGSWSFDIAIIVGVFFINKSYEIIKCHSNI